MDDGNESEDNTNNANAPLLSNDGQSAIVPSEPESKSDPSRHENITDDSGKVPDDQTNEEESSSRDAVESDVLLDPSHSKINTENTQNISEQQSQEKEAGKAFTEATNLEVDTTSDHKTNAENVKHVSSSKEGEGEKEREYESNVVNLKTDCGEQTEPKSQSDNDSSNLKSDDESLYISNSNNQQRQTSRAPPIPTSECPFSDISLGNDDVKESTEEDNSQSQQPGAGQNGNHHEEPETTTTTHQHPLQQLASSSMQTDSNSNEGTPVSGLTSGQKDNSVTLATDSSVATGRDVAGDVVLVTGGSGFLGQHIVKTLQLKAPHVAEIRVLDREPFKQKLEYEATKPVKVITGSVTDVQCVTSAVRGVNSVIHVAGLVSWGTFPDVDGMKRVNVQGTLNVVNACLQANVSRLIYCSTVDVVVGFDPIQGGEEDNTPVPDEFLFPAYPETKYQGERLVLRASAYAKEDGSHIQTLALRANVMYGELDPYYVVNGLRNAHKRKGVLYQIGDGSAMFQQSYVGNTAWAFICADVAMKNNPQLTSLPLFIPDNTPVQNSFNFMRPYLESRGFQVSKGHLPYRLVYRGLRVSEAAARLLSPITKISISAQSCTIAYINMDIFFKGDKAKRLLKYEPIFTPAEARTASLPYYLNVPL